MLGEIAARASMLQVACSHCERRGRYRLDALIARHGADAPVRIIVPKLTGNCPQRDSVALMERCDILFPQLRELFRAPLIALRCDACMVHWNVAALSFVPTP